MGLAGVRVEVCRVFRPMKKPELKRKLAVHCDPEGTDFRPRLKSVRAIGSPHRSCIEPAPAHPLSSDHAPIRFSCCRPTLALHLGLDFPWLMRWEPEDALDWGERTCSSATRTFHRWEPT